MKSFNLTLWLKRIYLIIGTLTLFLLLFKTIPSTFFSKKKTYSSNRENQLDYHHEQQKLILEGKTKKGIFYQDFSKIGYTNKYYLPISFRTFEEEKEVLSAISSSNNFNYNYNGSVNVIFVDSNFNLLNTLLDRPALIDNFDFPSGNKYDSLQQHILYTIAFEDSNQDSVLNNSDQLGLYISNQDGSDFRTILDHANVTHFEFSANFKKIRVTYEVYSNDPNQRKMKQFAMYDIPSHKLSQLSKVHDALKTVEDIMLQSPF